MEPSHATTLLWAELHIAQLFSYFESPVHPSKVTWPDGGHNNGVPLYFTEKVMEM